MNAPEPTGQQRAAAVAQAQVIAQAVDLRNPTWRGDLELDLTAALLGTPIDRLPAGHPGGVPVGAPGDRDHTPCPHEPATRPCDRDRGRELAERELTDDEKRDLGRRIADALDPIIALARDDEIDHANSDGDVAEWLGTLSRELYRYGWVMDERVLRGLAPLAGLTLAAPAEGEAGDGVRALVDRDGHRWIELATDRWWCLPDPAEGVDSIIGPDEVVEPGRSRASVERTDGPVREVRLAATPPAPEGEAGGVFAAIVPPQPEHVRRVLDSDGDAWRFYKRDQWAPDSPAVSDLGDRSWAALVAEFGPLTPAPAGPQAEGAGETAGSER